MTNDSGLQAAIAGRYVIEREVGAGGMAHVYLVQDGVQETYTPHTISSDGNRFVMLRSIPVKKNERSIAVLEHFLGR